MKKANRIDEDAIVKEVAEKLHIKSKTNLRDSICSVAEEKVDSWMSTYSISPKTLEDVQQAILNKIGLRIERIETDEDFERIQTKYLSEEKTLKIQLELEFNNDTEALVFKRNKKSLSASNYLAVVDARGSRLSRAWFAERHEPGHLIIPDPTANVVWRRTTVERPEPIEQIVDAVASLTGFWEPIVKPQLDKALASSDSILEAFDQVKNELAANASIESSYRAFVRLVDFPLILLRSDYDCRAEDKQPNGNPLNSLALRAKTIIWNDLAKNNGMQIWRNMRIPEESVISLSHSESSSNKILSEADNLNRWKSEKSGRSLPSCGVQVFSRNNWAAIVLK